MIFKRNKPKVALVLSGGGAKGYAHIGALKALSELGLTHYDAIVGSSAGAVIGAHYAMHEDIEKLIYDSNNIKKKHFWLIRDFANRNGGLIKGKVLLKYFKEIIGDISFNELKSKLIVNAYDLTKGKEVIIDSGNVVDGIRSSMSLPIIFEPVYKKGQILIDGGVVSRFPGHLVKIKDYRMVIGINLNQYQSPINYQKLNIFKIALLTTQCGTLSSDENARNNILKSKKSILIEPNLKDMNLLSFNKSKKVFQIGYVAVMDRKEEIEKKIKHYI